MVQVRNIKVWSPFVSSGPPGSYQLTGPQCSELFRQRCLGNYAAWPLLLWLRYPEHPWTYPTGLPLRFQPRVEHHDLQAAWYKLCIRILMTMTCSKPFCNTTVTEGLLFHSSPCNLEAKPTSARPLIFWNVGGLLMFAILVFHKTRWFKSDWPVHTSKQF